MKTETKENDEGMTQKPTTTARLVARALTQSRGQQWKVGESLMTEASNTAILSVKVGLFTRQAAKFSILKCLGPHCQTGCFLSARSKPIRRPSGLVRRLHSSSRQWHPIEPNSNHAWDEASGDFVNTSNHFCMFHLFSLCFNISCFSIHVELFRWLFPS